MLTELLTPENIIALLTLTSLEIVLGIDNIVFIAILAGKLPENQREKARKLGIMLAMFLRIGLLFSIGWVMSLTEPLFSLSGTDFSGKSLILLFGGLFLIYKATKEIHHKIEAAGVDEANIVASAASTFGAVLVQILMMDLIFSLDSVITAFGMTHHIPTMVIAIVVSVFVMLAYSGVIVRLVDKHPSLKILALSFLLMIGVMLTAEAFGKHIEKGYIYFAMAFALAVDFVQIKSTKTKLEEHTAAK